MRWRTAGRRWRLAQREAIPVGGRYAFRDMGMLSWNCVVASDHPLAKMEGPLSDDTFTQLALAGAGRYLRSLPKRQPGCWIISAGWSRPDWESSATCLSAGLCVGMVPVHFARPRIEIAASGIALTLENSVPGCRLLPDVAAKRRLARHGLAAGLSGDSETLNREWLREPERPAGPPKCINDGNRRNGPSATERRSIRRG